MSDDDMRAVIRTMIAQEDALRDQRLSWLFALNGLLFAAVGFSWSDTQSSPLVVVLAALGIAASLSVKVSLVASDIAVDNLRSRAGEIKSDEAPVWGADSVNLRKRGGIYRYASKLYPWTAMPWFLMVAWLAVAIGRVTR